MGEKSLSGMHLLVVFISGICNFKKTKENKPIQPRNGVRSWTKLSRGNTSIQSIVCKVGKLILLWDSISPLSEQLSSRKQKTTSVGEGVGEKVHVLSLGGSINWCGHGGCHVSVEASQTAKYRTSLWPSCITHGHLPKGLYILLQRPLLVQVLLFYLQQIPSIFQICLYHLS